MAFDEARLEELLRLLVERRGSDLHVKVGSPPHVRIDGHLQVTAFDAPTAADTEGFAEAMRRVLRQDPDVIFVGEMRDPETVWAALAAAETGHLVLSTLHTSDTIETVNRILDFFPAYQHKQIRLSFATSLRG